MGLNFNNYRFSNNFTLKNELGTIVPIPITDSNLEKTKLSTGYLTVPLLLEFQLPKETGIWMSMGLIGGMKMGSHTKVKIAGNKSKDHNDFNINPFRGGATARLGFKGYNIFRHLLFYPFL